MARVFISHSSRDNQAADRIKGWLREQGFDTPFLDFDKHAGIPPGADWEQTLYREIDRSEAVIIVQTTNWMDSKWCFAEFTQARALGKPVFPVIEAPTGERLISQDIQALDLTTDTEGGLEQLARQLTQIALDAQGGFQWDSTRPPYPGLMAFQEEDAAIYFGRDDDIRRLIERLNARRVQGGARLIALLGASGSGKSSLMRAGVIPRLKRAGRNWIVLPPMRPQTRPLDELARSLAIASGRGKDWIAIRDALGVDATGSLADLAAELRVRYEANEAQILLPVDQAEELFGASHQDEAQRFLRVLSETLAPELPFTALFAMRSDFLGALQAADRLSARFEEFSLGPMSLARVPQIIEGPARVVGLRVDDALVHQAAKDAETEDALPLLAFALRELYDRGAEDNCLSLDEYNALGDARLGLTPLENAVRRAADEVLADLRPDPDDLAALRDAFIPDMVRINDEGDYVRQPARWDALSVRAHPMLEALANARLLIIRQDEESRMVEVAHEALLRKWPRLRDWLDEAREFLLGKQQLDRDLRDWKNAASADKSAALLAGLKLTRARAWLTERSHQLSAEEGTYIQASIDRFEAEERRKARTRRLITASSVIAAIVLAAFAGFAGYQWFEAQAALAARDEAQDARAREQLRFVWQDLGSNEEEAQRLTSVARQFDIDPQALVPRVVRDEAELKSQCDTWLWSGFRHLYCSVRDIVSLEKIQAISGLDVFRKNGPHDTGLNLRDGSRFGHYNPKFLDWAARYLVPTDQHDPKFNRLTQLAYDTHIGPLARALYHSHQILMETRSNPETVMRNYEEAGLQYTARTDTNEQRFGSAMEPFDEIRNVYVEELESGEVTQWADQGKDMGERFRWLADYLATVEGDDWYLANTAGGFWVRREIDGTRERIFALVSEILQTFEPEVLRGSDNR